MAFDRAKPYNDLPLLPPTLYTESAAVLKAALRAGRALAELKGYCQTLPNPELLLNAVSLQESKDSSEIENIVTTQDELYRAAASPDDLPGNTSSDTKEVLRYREAMYTGWDALKGNGLLTTNTLIKIVQRLKNNQDGIRRMPGTVLHNPKTGQIIYTPPEGEDIIRNKLHELERFIHADNDLDPLVRMALIHYQIEAIHPFADGNGRTGRILNVLYLVQQQLLTMPVLYLSAYILANRDEYYHCLRLVTEAAEWEEWVLYMLTAVDVTARETLAQVTALQALRQSTYEQVRALLPTAPAREIADLLLSYPYVKIQTLINAGVAQRQTSSNYLKALAEGGLLSSLKIGRDIYYVNDNLLRLFSTARAQRVTRR
ncbi:MAG: Fic family protein [Hymenobacter sp.]|nr:MAG: Fic family protein [Hymenobacter sp.]